MFSVSSPKASFNVSKCFRASVSALKPFLCSGNREMHTAMSQFTGRGREMGDYRTTIINSSTVGIALDYGLDDRGSGVRFLAGAGNFSLHHRLQNGSGAHPASCPIGTRGSFPGGKAAGA
jgi:hypothetical protein